MANDARKKSSRDKNPSNADHGDASVLLPILIVLLNAARFVSGYHLLRFALHRGQFSWRLTELHSLAWFSVIGGGLLLHDASGMASVRVLALLAGYRLLELMHALLFFVFFEGGFGVQHQPHNAWILIASFAVIETTICFAAIILATAMQWNPAIESAGMAIYVSFITFRTLGYGEVVPTTSMTRFFVLAELSFFVLLLVLVLPSVVAAQMSARKEPLK